MLKVSMIVWNDFQNDARVLKEAQTLQAAGYQVTVFALHTPGITQKKETHASGVKVVRVSRSPFLTWRKHKIIRLSAHKVLFSRDILRIIARISTHLHLCVKLLSSKSDIIHAHDVNTLPTAYLAALFTRTSLVYDAHEISTSREGYASFRSLVYYLEKYLMPRAAATITTTDTRAKFFARVYHIAYPLVLQNRPCFIPLQKTSKIRDTLQLSNDWPIVLYQGGLQQGRGLERLIDAAAQIPQAYFVFIGSGRLESVLKQKVADLQLHHVYFIPTVPLQELLYYTVSADIGVQVLENTCLNHYSTDSNKLFEYIMAKLAIIASHFPEISRIIKQYDLGLLVAPDNTDELVRALNTLIHSITLRQYYQHQAGLAALHLDWEGQEKSLVDLYKKLSQNKI